MFDKKYVLPDFEVVVLVRALDPQGFSVDQNLAEHVFSLWQGEGEVDQLVDAVVMAQLDQIYKQKMKTL